MRSPTLCARPEVAVPLRTATVTDAGLKADRPLPATDAVLVRAPLLACLPPDEVRISTAATAPATARTPSATQTKRHAPERLGAARCGATGARPPGGGGWTALRARTAGWTGLRARTAGWTGPRARPAQRLRAPLVARRRGTVAPAVPRALHCRLPEVARPGPPGSPGSRRPA